MVKVGEIYDATTGHGVSVWECEYDDCEQVGYGEF